MSCHRNYDTVAFDVRDNAMILFFARTRKSGEIDDYLLLMRVEGEEFGNSLYIEVNEQQLAGHNLVREAHMAGNVLTLSLDKKGPKLDGESEIVISYDESAGNKACVEAGAFRVLGDRLAGGHA